MMMIIIIMIILYYNINRNNSNIDNNNNGSRVLHVLRAHWPCRSQPSAGTTIPVLLLLSL